MLGCCAEMLCRQSCIVLKLYVTALLQLVHLTVLCHIRSHCNIIMNAVQKLLKREDDT